MRRLAIAMTALATTSASAQWTGYVQLRDVQRTRDVNCQALDLSGCRTMVREASTELLYDGKPAPQLQLTGRFDLIGDEAIGLVSATVRELSVEWHPSSVFSVKAGRQILTWGVSDYLYVNDIFPKDYDDFFTGGDFSRTKAPVDGVRLSGRMSDTDIEVVASRSAGDLSPRIDRFAALAGGARSADNANDQVDVAARVTSHVGDWDVAGYVASFRTREQRFFTDGNDLVYDRPRDAHIGFSLTGNAAGGVTSLEAALRHTGTDRNDVVSRDFLPSAVKLIAGYSSEVSQDLTASTQLQLDTLLSRNRYRNSLAPGIRPVATTLATLNVRLQRQWSNQTVATGAQLFITSEGDFLLNPFTSWSPADGWTIQGGVNLFDGKPDTNWGAFENDSNIYILVRYSF